MNKFVLLEGLAKARRVETLCESVTHTSGPDVQDLVQLVYMALLSTPAARLAELEAKGEMDFYIVKIAKNQWFGSRSKFYHDVRGFRRRADEFREEVTGG